MWTDVRFNDENRLQRSVELLKVVSELYERAEADGFVRSWMKLHDGRLFLYQDNGTEIVVATEFNPRREMHVVKAIGFVGEPQQVADLTSQKIEAFLRETRTTQCCAFVGQCLRHEPFGHFMECMIHSRNLQLSSEVGIREYAVWKVGLKRPVCHEQLLQRGDVHSR